MYDPLNDKPVIQITTLALDQTDVPFECMLFEQGDLSVTRDGVLCSYNAVPVLATQYKIVTTYGEEGGTVQFGAAAAGGERVILQREVAKDRTGQLNENGTVSMVALNNELTRQAAMIQDLAGKLDDLETRALRFGIGETAPVIEGVSSIIGTDENGDPILYDPDDFEGPPGPAIDQTLFAEMLVEALVAGANVTITDNLDGTVTFAVDAGAAYTAENMRDDFAAAAVSGNGITVTHDDGANTLTFAINATYMSEFVQDIVGAMTTAGTGITASYNDAGNIITLSVNQDAIYPQEAMVVELSTVDAAPTAGTKFSFRPPFNMTILDQGMAASTAQTSGNVLRGDVLVNGATIFSTKPTLDNGEETTSTASTPAARSTSSIAAHAEVQFVMDQVGDGTARGVTMTLTYRRAA